MSTPRQSSATVSNGYPSSSARIVRAVDGMAAAVQQESVL